EGSTLPIGEVSPQMEGSTLPIGEKIVLTIFFSNGKVNPSICGDLLHKWEGRPIVLRSAN
ncbi:MAG: hypothetical protein EBU46_17570, partial [Nitrosomonadaceae bacterium]|nr:hypothetical protein [Nitrosomonadaceae bacterium]